MFKYSALTFLFIVSLTLNAQSLFRESIRPIASTKKSIFLQKGIFHHNSQVGGKTILKAVRHSHNASKGYERIVFDFSSNNIPKVYGYIGSSERRIYIDFFNTQLTDQINSFGSSHFVKALDFFPIDESSLSTEIHLKDSVGADIFYLKNPGRLVIDIKK